MSRISGVARLFACWLLTLFIAGCGGGHNLGEPAKVSGKITRKDKPLANVTVGFATISAGVPGPYRYASGKTDANGEYLIEKVYPGEYTVSISEDVPPPDATGKVSAVPGDPVLAKYGLSNSPIKTEIAGAEVEFNYDIKE